MILDTEKVTARRLMWFPMLGAFNTQAFGYRWATEYGLLEFRMNSMGPQEEEQFRALLSQCLNLENNILNVSADLDTDTAGPWKRNKAQLRENTQLYTMWRLKLCQFIGLNPGPQYRGNRIIM